MVGFLLLIAQNRVQRHLRLMLMNSMVQHFKNLLQNATTNQIVNQKSVLLMASLPIPNWIVGMYQQVSLCSMAGISAAIYCDLIVYFSNELNEILKFLLCCQKASALTINLLCLPFFILVLFIFSQHRQPDL